MSPDYLAAAPPATVPPRRLLRLAVLICFAGFVAVALPSIIVGTHWIWSLWFGYGWPSDKGNGPEAIQQTALYAVIAAVLVPAVRRFLAFEFNRVHAKLEAHTTELREHLEEHGRMMRHVIEHHPDIPPLPPKP